jgi:hypothetical protein
MITLMFVGKASNIAYVVVGIIIILYVVNLVTSGEIERVIPTSTFTVDDEVIIPDKVIDVKSNPTSEFERGEQAIISGMGYTVTSVTVTNSLPVVGIYAGSGEKVVYANYKVKNLSNDPKKEQQGFSLKDSSGKKFKGYYMADKGDSVFGTIQPGMSGKTLRYAVFVIPFDPELEYKLIGGNIIINLGKGYSFNFN